ncbi:hypothetical protein KAR91_73730, partial [Candidatus Pacearchaeota archaeon]|nr:hypothetical protein [Candidatus Pacearchaeota archaeon]
IKSEPKKSGPTNLDRVSYRRLLVSYNHLEKQINNLARYLMVNEFHTDPKLTDNSGSAVDLAIRLLKLYTNRTN